MWYYVPFISAPATEDSSSPSDDTPAPWLTLSGTPTQRPLSWRGWQRRAWIKLLSGMTSPPSTVARGVAEWISSLPVSPASRSAQQASGWALTTSVGSGPTSQGSSATWNPATCSWRTSQELFEQDLPMFSVTLPTSGSMRNGVCSPRPPLVRPIGVNGSGLWLTATGMDSRAPGGNPHGTGTHGTTSTDRAVRQWPTPKAQDQPSKNGPGDRARNSPNLVATVAMWPTPRASMNENRTTKDAPSHGVTHGRTLAGTASHHAPTTSTGGPSGMVLNPRFVEVLMGVPNGWLTPSISAETGLSHSAPAKRGGNSPSAGGGDHGNRR